MAPHPSQNIRPIQFVIATSLYELSKEQQQLVRSHASRGRAKRRHRPRLKSWILQRDGDLSHIDDQYTSIPPRVGWELSFLDFPIEIQPYMQGDLALALSPLKEALYPPEICLQVDPMSSSWTTALLTDPVYLHCTLYSVEAYLELILQKSHSPLRHFHFHKTIRLLQARLDTPDHPESISDPTIMVVSVLGLTTELTGDYLAAEKHLEGLRKMVELRGGLETLRFSNSRLPAKLCRIDLTLALRFGIRPIFFNDTIPWKPFVANCGLIVSAPAINEENSNFLKSLDKKLINIWKDLKEFSRICNLASQTSHKLQPNTFSEIMISILYRLLNLTFTDDTVAEAIRVGMIAFGAGIFLQWRGIKQRLTYLGNLSQKALLNLKNSERRVPSPILLWLLVAHVSTALQPLPADELSRWTDNTISELHIGNWRQAYQVLKSVMWIDALHNELLNTIIIPGGKTNK